MEIVFLGTGTSQGVPMIACDCAVCRSTDPRNKRSRTSVHVIMGGMHLQVDAAPEFREQCIRNGIVDLDAFLLTHGHADHVMGMDDLRRFCDKRGFAGLPVYSSPEGLEKIRTVFPYAIGTKPLFRGYPAFVLHTMPSILDLGVGTISTTVLPHGPMQVLGLVFQEAKTDAKFVYYTDCKAVGAGARDLARGADVVVLDALRPESHPTHMSIKEALDVAGDIGGKTTYLTHMTHSVDHGPTEAALPENIHLAYDGLRVTL